MGMNNSLFLSCLTTLIIMNVIIAYMKPENMMFVLINIGLGFVVGFLIPAVIALIIAGVKITVLASSIELSDEAISLAFGISFILALLFQVQIAIPVIGTWLGLNLPLGAGLGQNLLQYFPINEGGGLGFFMVIGLIFITLTSGIMVFRGSGE